MPDDLWNHRHGSGENEPMEIELDGVHLSYGGAMALEDISIRLGGEAAVALIGRNGAGKSSILRVCAGAVAPRSGQVKCTGQGGRWNLRAAVKAGVRLVPESGNVFPALSVIENLRSGWVFGSRRDVELRVDEVFACLPILDGLRDRRAGNLSGGERQALAIGRALVGDVRLLLLDEPSLGLSPLLSAQLFDRLKDIRKARGFGIVVAEQNLSFISELCSEVCWVETGRVKHLGGFDEVRKEMSAELSL